MFKKIDIFSLTSPCLKGVIAPLATAIRNKVSVACINKHTQIILTDNPAHEDLVSLFITFFIASATFSTHFTTESLQ